MQLNGQSSDAIPILEAMPQQGGVGAQRNAWLALANAAAGRYALAADTVLAIPPNQVLISKTAVEEAGRLMRRAPARIEAAKPSAVSHSLLGFVYAFTGAPDRLLDLGHDAIELNWAGNSAFWTIWHPSYAPLRKTQPFKAFMRDAGLVDYWRAKGWPDLCHPSGADEFACD
jgi:hypothetical protein